MGRRFGFTLAETSTGQMLLPPCEMRVRFCCAAGPKSKTSWSTLGRSLQRRTRDASTFTVSAQTCPLFTFHILPSSNWTACAATTFRSCARHLESNLHFTVCFVSSRCASATMGTSTTIISGSFHCTSAIPESCLPLLDMACLNQGPTACSEPPLSSQARCYRRLVCLENRAKMCDVASLVRPSSAPYQELAPVRPLSTLHQEKRNTGSRL